MGDKKRKRLNIVDAAKARRDLRKFCCSEFWVGFIVPKINDSQWELRRDRYETYKRLMEVCKVCRRRCPRYGPKGSPCCDCEVEKSEEWFDKLIKKWLPEGAENAEAQDHAGLVLELSRLWWRGPMSYKAFMENPMAGAADVGTPATSTEDWQEFADATPGIGFYPTEEEVSKRRSAPYVAVEKAIRALSAPKQGSGRAPGCQIVLLLETAQALGKEIAHFKQKWQKMSEKNRWATPYFAVLRSARRINRPYGKTRQRDDFLPGLP